MYLWRSLPEGQLLAVLRWMQSRRQPVRAAEGSGTAESPPPPVQPVKPAPR